MLVIWVKAEKLHGERRMERTRKANGQALTFRLSDMKANKMRSEHNGAQ